MANTDDEKTLADYVAIAISPALVMMLVGSLVFFLVEVLLGPRYPGQLLWILFFFVFAIVLVARISMSSDIADRAGAYGLVLAVLVWAALMIYVAYPSTSGLAHFAWLVNGVLVIITWWSSHRLTVDSTLIDDKDASGAGLLQEAGLDNPATPGTTPEEPTKKRKREPGGLAGWLQRFVKYRQEAAKRPHAPGVWVVYFSLAALPLFGLGQSLIPAEALERRRYAFWLMTMYVASGLGLLLTTSFLNLRRYLRQRNLKMPMAMTGAWLTGGILIIAVLLVLGALIPRPHSEYPIVDLRGSANAKEREGSQNAQGKGWGKEKGDAAAGPKDGAGKTKGKTKKGGEPGGGKKGSKDGGGGEGKDPSDKGAGKNGEAAQGFPAVDWEGDGGEGDGGEQGDTPPSSSPSTPPKLLPEVSESLMTLLKWIVGGLVVLVIVFVLLRALLRFLANFTHWAKRLLASLQRFWDGLFGWWRHGRLPEAALDEPESAAPPAPFASFRDPFLTGAAERMSPAELVRYSFDALLAWAAERGLERRPGETPLEFVERVTLDFPALERTAQEVVNLYLALAYARRVPAAERLEGLRKFWRLLTDLVERPMSAAV
jgi:hypothetical protein